MTKFVNGFAIDDTGRIVINETDPIKSTNIGIPAAADGTTCATMLGPVVNANNRAGFNAEGRLVYVDAIGNAAVGKTYFNGGMPFAEDMRLVCDSGNPVATHLGGLPITTQGFLAIASRGAITEFVCTEAGDHLTTEAGDSIIL